LKAYQLKMSWPPSKRLSNVAFINSIEGNAAAPVSTGSANS
jgi:hypothetical protein